MIRIVSTEQLTKEREAEARVEEAKLKAEIDTRTKLAEAQLKEQELAASKIAADAAAAEERSARGPLREETIRLSYADPEEVAKTLQGILGIPPEGTQVSGDHPAACRRLISSVGAEPRPAQSSRPFSAALRAGPAAGAPLVLDQPGRARQGHHDPRPQADEHDLHPPLPGRPRADQEAHP